MNNSTGEKLVETVTHSSKYTCSALLCYYRNDNPLDLKKALNSIFNQNLSNFEVVIVRDGPVEQNLESIIESFQQDHQFKHIKLAENQGLALALNAGLAESFSDYIIRCDADDFNNLKRFEKLLIKLEEGFDVVGSSVVEVDPATDVKKLKKQPLSDSGIKKEMCLRNSMNHQSVAFRKDKIIALGGYRDVHLAEDYDLWLRAIAANSTFANLEEPLVTVTAGDAMLKRRRGIRFLVTELELMKLKLKIENYSFLKVLSFTLLRLFARYSPILVVKWIYTTFLRTSLPKST